MAVYSDALVLLGTAGVVIPLVRRWGSQSRFSAIWRPAHILGPLGLGSFIRSRLPFLYWFTVGDAKNVAGIAELGVVFLRFLIGLELSLSPPGRRCAGWFSALGGPQVLGDHRSDRRRRAAAGEEPAGRSNHSRRQPVAVVDRDRARAPVSPGTADDEPRTSFSVLLAQDLAVIPILVFISILAAVQATGAGRLATALLQARRCVLVIVVFGRLLMRPLFRLVAATRSPRPFIAAVLFVIVARWRDRQPGRTRRWRSAFCRRPAAGANRNREAIQATIEPFKSLLLGIFFFTVGMEIDFREL